MTDPRALKDQAIQLINQRLWTKVPHHAGISTDPGMTPLAHEMIEAIIEVVIAAVKDSWRLEAW